MKKMTQDEIIAALIRLKQTVIRQIEQTPGNQSYNLELVTYISDANISIAKGETPQ